MGGVEARDPSAVLGRLNAAFQMEQHSNMFFTIWYGVYRRRARTLVYSGGGHPAPLLTSGKGGETLELESPGLPMGILPGKDFPTLSAEVVPGASLLVYSDGVTEVFYEPGKLWGTAGLLDFVRDHDPAEPTFLDQLHSRVTSIARRDVLEDDFSTVLARFA